MKKLLVGAIFLMVISPGYSLGAGKTIYAPNPKNMDKFAKEAVKIAKDNMAEIVVKCGDFIYVRTAWSDLGTRNYIRFKKPIQIFIDGGSRYVTEADKMNGIEWKAYIDFSTPGPLQMGGEQVLNMVQAPD